MTPHQVQLKRLKHVGHEDRHVSVLSRMNRTDSQSTSSSDEMSGESSESSPSIHNENSKTSRTFKPAPHRARRGGMTVGRSQDRQWHPNMFLPKRAINYDLAESFMDHSTNPLSSDLYKIRFKHSTKQWPNGRFLDYKEKLDRMDGNIIEIGCTRTFPIVPKRKRVIETKTSELTPIVLKDLSVQQAKRKQIDKQTNFYANLFGTTKIPRLPTAAPIKKPIPILTSSSSSISLLDQANVSS